MSYPLSAYRQCIAEAFCPLLLGLQYSSNLPNQDRLVKFLSRLKEAQFEAGDPVPGLTLTELCKTGLPPNWCYLQYNRGPLMPVEEDEFRVDKDRVLTGNKTLFDENRWGYGRCELNFWLLGNNGSAIEAAESLFYIRIYKVRSFDYLYLDIPWRSRVIHDPLQTFEAINLAEYGTGFSVTWRSTVYVPILRQEIEGYTVQSTCTGIFDARMSIDLEKMPPFPAPVEFDLSKSVSMDLSVRSQYNPSIGETVTQEVEHGCGP
jgi:hypothetical protein